MTELAGESLVPLLETAVREVVESGGAAAERVPIVYDELRALAASLLRGERRGHTLQSTALVHEAYLRLRGASDLRFRDEAHFVAIASRLMRQILVEHARRRGAAKRGAGRLRVSFDADMLAERPDGVDLLEVDQALAELGGLHERRARVVELKFFGGLTAKEIAEVLGISVKTVEADWYLARAWLRLRLKEKGVALDDS